MGQICDNAARVCEAIVEFAVSMKWFITAATAVKLCQSIKGRCWEDDKSGRLLQQLKGLGAAEQRQSRERFTEDGRCGPLSSAPSFGARRRVEIFIWISAARRAMARSSHRLVQMVQLRKLVPSATTLAKHLFIRQVAIYIQK